MVYHTILGGQLPPRKIVVGGILGKESLPQIPPLFQLAFYSSMYQIQTHFHGQDTEDSAPTSIPLRSWNKSTFVYRHICCSYSCTRKKIRSRIKSSNARENSQAATSRTLSTKGIPLTPGYHYRPLPPFHRTSTPTYLPSRPPKCLPHR